MDGLTEILEKPKPILYSIEEAAGLINISPPPCPASMATIISLRSASGGLAAAVGADFATLTGAGCGATAMTGAGCGVGAPAADTTPG